MTLLLALLFAPPALAEHALVPDEAMQQAGRGDLTIIDVRLPLEWQKTGLPAGAKGIPLQDEMTFEVRPGFARDVLRAVGSDKDEPIALICARGNRSAAAQELLAEAGFTDVHDISEGMVGGSNGPGWLARNLPTVRCQAC